LEEIKLERVDFDFTRPPRIDPDEEVSYAEIRRSQLDLTLPLSCLDAVGEEATVTLVASDFHLGHCDFLPETYHSCLARTQVILTWITKKFDVVKFNLLLNGDMVSGQEIYKYQQFDNLLQRGQWQVELAKRVTEGMVRSLSQVRKLDKIFLIRGTHEHLGQDYARYLTYSLPNAYYAGTWKIINIAHPIGKYNILFTHGFGSSSYYPVSYSLIRDCWKALLQGKKRGIPVEEIVVAHSHWLQPRLTLEGLTFSVSGGFQRWSKTASQRPSGFLLLLYTGGECSVSGLRPDLEVEAMEKGRSDLEFRNLEYYSYILREGERVREPEEFVGR